MRWTPMVWLRWTIVCDERLRITATNQREFRHQNEVTVEATDAMNAILHGIS